MRIHNDLGLCELMKRVLNFGMLSFLSFNVVSPNGKLLCPACGFEGYSDEPAYFDHGGRIGIAICPCCMWEPGFDDEPLASGDAEDTILKSLIAYRSRWWSTKVWQGQSDLTPTPIDGQAQLLSLKALAPYLF